MRSHGISRHEYRQLRRVVSREQDEREYHDEHGRERCLHLVRMRLECGHVKTVQLRKTEPKQARCDECPEMLKGAC